ncbi:hypothetical protein CEXT_734561, partial [Caerostris extrusa]
QNMVPESENEAQKQLRKINEDTKLGDSQSSGSSRLLEDMRDWCPAEKTACRSRTSTWWERKTSEEALFLQKENQ